MIMAIATAQCKAANQNYSPFPIGFAQAFCRITNNHYAGESTKLMRDGQCSSGNRSDELVESGSRFLGSSLVLLSPYVRDLNSNGMEMSGKAADSCERL